MDKKLINIIFSVMGLSILRKKNEEVKYNINSFDRSQKNTDIQPKSRECISSVSLSPAVLNPININTQTESKEKQRYQYLEKYQKFKKQVIESPAFANNPDWKIDPWEIDVEIASIILSYSPTAWEEVEQVLSQSPQVRAWKTLFSQEDYSRRTSEYINNICKWAKDLQQWRGRQASSELIGKK